MTLRIRSQSDPNQLQAMIAKLLLTFLLVPTIAFGVKVTKIVGTGTNDASVGNIAHTEVGDITADDGNTTGGISGDEVRDDDTHNRLKGTMSGNVFTVPGSATIDSIRVVIGIIDRRNNLEGQDLEVRLLKANNVVGDDESKPGAVLGSLTDVTYAPGGLWSTTWTPAQINATDFGVTYRGHVPTQSGRYRLGIDHMTITVIYTEAAGGDIPSRRNRLLRNTK